MKGYVCGDILRTELGELVMICPGQNMLGRSLIFVMIEDGTRRFYPIKELRERICNVADFDILTQEPDETVGHFLQLIRHHETGKRLNSIQS